jgi:hypothetical protein
MQRDAFDFDKERLRIRTKSNESAQRMRDSNKTIEVAQDSNPFRFAICSPKIGRLIDRTAFSPFVELALPLAQPICLG